MINSQRPLESSSDRRIEALGSGSEEVIADLGEASFRRGHGAKASFQGIKRRVEGEEVKTVEVSSIFMCVLWG